MRDLQETLKYLRKDMERVEAVISDLLHFGDALMQEVGQYLSATKGKRMRPALTLLSARLNGAPSGCEAHDRVAASLEIVHLGEEPHGLECAVALPHRGLFDHAPFLEPIERSEDGSLGRSSQLQGGAQVHNGVRGKRVDQLRRG